MSIMIRSDWSHRAYIGSWAFLFLASALDGWATVKGMGRLGSSFEANPIFRALFGMGILWFWAYKVAVVVGFIWLIDKLIHSEILIGLGRWVRWGGKSISSGVARQVLKWEVAGIFVCVGLVFIGYGRDWMWTLAQTQPKTEVAWRQSFGASAQEEPEATSKSEWQAAGSLGRAGSGESEHNLSSLPPTYGIKGGKDCDRGEEHRAFDKKSCRG